MSFDTVNNWIYILDDFFLCLLQRLDDLTAIALHRVAVLVILACLHEHEAPVVIFHAASGGTVGLDLRHEW